MVVAYPSPSGLLDPEAVRVRRAQEGDHAAFDELVHAHRETIERVVRQFVRNGEDAADIAQEAWIRAAASLRQLREPERFRPWLKRIARNSSLTFLKRQQAHPVATLDAKDAPEVADDHEATPEQHLLSRDEQSKVWETLGSLSERDRLAIIYREHLGMPYTEIAERLGIARNTAEVCVSRARERFRRVFLDLELAEGACRLDGLRLAMYLDGELDEFSRHRAQNHLAVCAPCVCRLEAMSAGKSATQRLASCSR